MSNRGKSSTSNALIDYRLVRRAVRPNEGAIDWLLACPRKDFFVPIDSESTDTL